MDGSTLHRVLVLNRVWQAVNIVGIQRAFSLLIQDHAQVIHNQAGHFEIFDAEHWLAHSAENPPSQADAVIRTIRLAIRVPKVLLLRSYDRLPTKEVRFNRSAIFERDGYRCQYCGRVFEEHELNLDHVIPRDRGGKTNWENIVTSCIHCNARKANRLPHEAGMQLIRKPQRPKWRPFVSSIAGEQIDSAWQYFLGNRKAVEAS